MIKAVHTMTRSRERYQEDSFNSDHLVVCHQRKSIAYSGSVSTRLSNPADSGLGLECIIKEGRGEGS